MKLLKFESKDCSPCVVLSSLLEFPEFKDFKVEVFDIDTPDGLAEARKRQIRHVPTLVKILDDGAETFLTGLPSQVQLRKWLGVDTPSYEKD